MKSKHFTRTAMVGVVLSLFSLAACSTTGSKGTGEPVQRHEEVAVQKTPPVLSKEEMMAKWQQFSTPGTEHKVLSPLVGSWDHTAQMWMEPNTPPEVSKGRSDVNWVMGGRFIEHSVKGKSMGKPFEGRGIVGYDKASNEYRSIWFDNMGTGLMVGTGTYDSTTKTLTETGTVSCPIKGQMSYRGVTTWVDPNHYQYDMYMTSPGEPETKMMHIDYTRRNKKS